MPLTIPPTLEQRVIAGEAGLEDIVPLYSNPENVVLFRCQKCGVPRPPFAIYDTRGVEGFDTDWTCESDLRAVLRGPVG